VSAATTQVPPQNVEAEESVLGAMLVAEPALERVIGEVRLEESDFYLDRHRAIFEAIRGLHSGSRPVDELTVTAALTGRQREPFEKVGADPRHYVSELAAKVPAAGNAKHYAKIVKQHGHSRRVIEAAQQAIEAAHADGSINGEAAGLAELLSKSINAGEIATVKGSDVTLRAPRFLDESRMIPRRSITVAFGVAGLGKTIYGLNRCAAVTTGHLAGLDAPGLVLISSQEDDPEAVLAPRLVAAGADLERIHFVSGLSLPSQVPALAARARTLKAELVLIDPIGAHFDPQIDSHRDAATRAALAPLADMATELDLAVLVVAHPNKATGQSGLARISGSGAFGNAARSVIVFGLDPGDPDGETGDRRIIAHLKCNVGKRAPSISAEIKTATVVTQDGEAIVPRLHITGLSDHSADDILASPTREERTDREAARDFLAEQLGDGPVRTKEIRAAAKEADIASWRTVERAKGDLGAKAAKGPDGWYWLPAGREEL
jgi:putative DNA primase/helicase